VLLKLNEYTGSPGLIVPKHLFTLIQTISSNQILKNHYLDLDINYFCSQMMGFSMTSQTLGHFNSFLQKKMLHCALFCSTL